MPSYSNAGIFNGSIVGTGVTISGIDWGTGVNRVITLGFNWRSQRKPNITALTIGGESLSILGSNIGFLTNTNNSFRVAILVNPTVSGVADLVVTATSLDNGNSDFNGTYHIAADGDPTMGTPSVYVSQGNPGPPASTVMSTTVTSTTDALVVAHFASISSDPVYNGTASGAMTERAEGVSTSGISRMFCGDAPGAASVVCTETLDDTAGSGVTDWIAIGLSLPSVVVTPSQGTPLRLGIGTNGSPLQLVPSQGRGTPLIIR